MTYNTVARTCQSCQQSFFCTPTQARMNWGKFCSKRCSMVARWKLKQRPAAERLLSHVSKQVNGCWLWTAAKDPKGYGEVRHRGKKAKAHRLSYELFVGVIPPGLMVCHHCDTPSCVAPDHLFLGTNTENILDSCRKLRQSHKLTVEQVRAIRVDTRTYDLIASEFGISISHVSNIKHRRCWAYIV